MTRQFNQTSHCVNCGALTSTETSFGRWVRENKSLDSVKHSLVLYDVDYIVHKYKTDANGRDVQLIMFVEVKTHGSNVTDSQRDTLYLINQLIENRVHNNATRKSKDKSLRNNMHRSLGRCVEVWSTASKKYVQVKSFGVFTLRFEGYGDPTKDMMAWNNSPITEDQLEQLLRFDISPTTFRPLDLRNRHAEKQFPLLDGIT